MPNFSSIVPIGLDDPDVRPRDKKLNYLPIEQQLGLYKKSNSVQINQDKNKEYTITEHLITSMPDGVVYDNNVLILEWHFSAEGHLIVTSYTEKQVNLLANIAVKECSIKARGPVFINGKIECDAAITIEAEALFLTKSLQSGHSVLLNAHQDICLLAPVQAQNLIIHAAYVSQQAGLELSGQLDVATQYFKQDASVKTNADLFHLITSQGEMKGELTVNKKCFLTADILVFGDEASQSTFKLLGDNHFHVGDLHVQGDTQIRIGNADNYEKSNFIIDQNLILDEHVIIDIFNSKLSVNGVDNQGELSCHQCLVEAKTVHQDGIFDTEQSLVTIFENFTHYDNALTGLKSTNFSAPNIRIYGGTFSTDSCYLKTKYIKTIASNTIVNDSIIIAQIQIEFWGSTKVTKSCLWGNMIMLKGELAIEDVQIIDEIDGVPLYVSTVQIISEQATINSLFSFSDKFFLQGSKKPEQVVLRECVFTTNRFCFLDHSTAVQSIFFGVAEENISHDIRAHVRLIGSRFITKNQLSNYAGSKFEMDAYSRFRAGLLYSQGKIEAKDSNIICNDILQERARFTLESSTVEVKHSMISQASKMILKNNAAVVIPKAQLQQGSVLQLDKNCHLVASSALTTSFDSAISSKQSNIIARKFIASGYTELCFSMLSAEELFIYNQFEANTKSQIAVERLMLVAQQAHARLSDSVVVSNDLQTFGDVVVHDAVVAAHNRLSVWSPAAMTLEGNTLVSAKDMVVRGVVTTQKKATPTKQEGKELRSASQLQIDGQLLITKSASVSGTADLAIEVDRYLHLGTMNLDANLRAKGNVLNNLGSISAKNIYLGFDKQVANLGSFSAENMTVHSNFLNLTGEVYADSSLAMAGFYEANWGLIVTNNYSNNTLFSLNGGLALSNPLIDLEHIFSWGNAVSVGKVIANTLLPKYSDVINLALIAPDLLKRAATFYDAYDNFDLKDCRTMRIHELMPKICQFKSTYLMFRNAFNMTKETPGEFSTLMTDVYNMADWVCDSKTYSMDFLKSVVFLVDWERLGADIISVVSSDYTNNSLIDVNFGVCFAPSMAKKSLFSVNTGVEASLITHNVDTQFLYNSGWSGGGKAVFKAEQGYNLGSLKGFNQLICKADDMINTGLIGGNNADVNIKHLSQKGQLLLNHGQAQILEFDGADNACTKLTDVVVTGKTLFSDGIFHLDDSEIKMTQVHLSDSAQETFKNSILTTTQFIDDSQLSYQGQVTIVTGHYAHNGQVVSINSTEEDAGKNLFYVKAKTADLHGAAALDNAVFDIENFADATHFVSGLDQYNRYAVSEHLAFKTQNDIILDSPFYRDCDLSVRASGITMISDYNKARDLSLSSTAGDVLLLSNITTSNLYVDSAGSIKNNHSIFCNGVANFTAAGIFYNLGGTVNADKVGIQAAGIKNLFATTQNTTNSCFNQFGLSLDTEYLSEVAVSSQNPWAVTMGSSGIINGRTDVYLEATASDIENKGGVIRAGNYAQLIAQGNIINTCAVRPSRSAYDTVYEFDGGLIAGGSGTDTEGVGLYVKAGQKIISDASDFVSNGINYLEGDQGFEFQARQDTHISKIKKSKTQYGQKSKEITTSTTVRNSSVHSAAGCTILVTEHGGIHSVATRFSSPGGTQIKSRDEVQLYSLKTQNNKYKSSSSLWGLSKRSILETHQEALPSLFIDNGVTRIYSTEGAIDARGAYFVGAGDLEMKARGRIKFGVDVLDHEVVDKTRSFEVSAPGMGAWKSWRNGGNLMDAVSAEDASMAKLNSMLRSNNGSELLANSVNLGINLYNTTNSMMRGLASGTLNNELFARYGLGGDKGFSPAISFSMSESETITKYQTQSPGGVDRKGNVLLDAGEGIDLEHGVRVHAGGKMVVNAPEIIATAAALHSSVDQKIASQTIKASITGQMQDFSAGYSHSSTEATNFINAELSADGTMSLGCEGGAMRHVVLDGARIEAGTLDAKIERLDIIDKQDTTVIRNESVNASLLGQISIHKGTGDSAITVQHSGISVVDGINNNGHTVHIDEAHMHGGTILTDGENHIEIDKLITEKVFDHQSYQSIGIGLNVNDLQRLTGKKATNQAGEHAIAIAEVTFDRTDYKAETTTVIHGAQETYPGIKELVGGATAIGTKIIKEQQLHVTLDIPVTNSDYIEQSRANIQAGLDKIVSVIKSNDIPGIEIAAMEEKTRSSRRREEEEEEEEEADGSVEKDKPDTDKESASDNDKIIDEDDLLFSPEEQKALWDGVWTHMSEHDREAIKEDLIALKQQEENGVINPATRDKLEQDIKSAFLQVFKAGATKSWTRFSRKIETEMADKFFRTLAAPDAFSKLTIKTYLGSKGVMIRLAFNLGLKSINNEPDVIKSAITSTAGEISFNILLSYSTGSLAGPVSWTFIGLGILDTLFYDQQYVDKLLEDEVALIHKAQESIKEGKLLQGIAEQMMAADQIQAASQMQAMHYLLVPLSYFGKAYDALWDKIAEPRKAAVFEKPSHYAASSRNSFFRVAEPDVTDKAKYQPCP